MANREKLLDAIESEVFLVFSQDASLDINNLAITLSSRYPQSGMPIDAICSQIENSFKLLRDRRSNGAAL